MFWARFINAHLAWQKFDVDFTKIFDRIFIISGVVLFFVCRRLLKVSVNQLGLTPATRAWHDVILGSAISLTSMVVLVALMALAGSFDPSFRLSVGETLARCGKAFAAAVTVA